jgi:dTMP kinase
MAKKYPGVFIVLEGPDKSGKSTQAQAIIKRLNKSGRETVWTREPGGTPLAEAVRAALLNPVNTVDPMAELLLYEASRAQHVAEKIIPALKAGKVVLCERFTMSTEAYQGYGRGLSLATIKRLNDIATGGLTPDATFVFDIPEEQFNMRSRKRPHDRLELEPTEFRTRVRRGYRELSKTTPGAIRINAAKPLLEVREDIFKALDRTIK